MATAERVTVSKWAGMGRASQADDPRAFFLSMLTLDYGLKSSEAMLAWLNNAIEQIKTESYAQ